MISTAIICLLGLPGTSVAGILDELVFEHGIAFFDDLKYPADFTHFEYLNPDAPKGGRLVLAQGFSFDTLAPIPPGESGAPSGYHYRGEPLIIRSGDEVAAFYGRLADGIAVTPDERTIVFRIHPDARWDDGVPVTSRDVVFTFKEQMEEVGAGYFFRFILAVEALDDRHVAFRLDAPLRHDHVTLIQYQPILPEHYWLDRDPTAHTMEPPIFSGPYRVADVKMGSYIEYQRNPDYWGWNLPQNQGRYNFDTVRYEIYRDGSVARAAFRKGLVDMLDEEDIRYWVNAYEGTAMENGWIQRIGRKYGIWVGIGRAFILNSRLPRLADRRVRKALTLAMNFEWINQKMYYDNRTRAQSYWPGTILSATGMPSEGELELLEDFRAELPRELFEHPFAFPDSSTAEKHRENLLAARALLADAGWQIKDGALRNAKGEPFTLEFVSYDGTNARILLPWFKTLGQLGIVANVRLVDISQFTNRIRRHDYDALVQSHDFLMPPTLEVRANFHSSAAVGEGSRNYMGVSEPVIDFLVKRAEESKTLAQLIDSCRALDRVLMWNYYLIPLYAYDVRRTVYWDKFGRPPEPLYRPAYPDGWWYDEKKAVRIKLDP